MTGKTKGYGEYLALLLVWAGLLLLFGVLAENFLSARTLGALANRIPSLTVVAVGKTFVLIVGGIDLSVGSVLGLAGAVLGVALVGWHWPLWCAATLALGTGLIAGLLTGAVSVRLGVPSFIVSLGMLEIARGGAFLVTDSQTKYLGAPVESLARPVAGLAVSPAFLLALGLVVVGQLALTRTVFGRYVIAIGTNEAAARLAGLATRGPRIAVFALAGALAALGGVLHTSRLGSSDPNAGVGLELSAIAAVVIGGTSLMGGRGSVVNTFFGVLIIATLESGLAQIGASEPVKRVVTGLVIVVAVAFDAWRSRLRGGPLAVMRRLFARPAVSP
jgi:ribose transport system permease protein